MRCSIARFRSISLIEPLMQKKASLRASGKRRLTTAVVVAVILLFLVFAPMPMRGPGDAATAPSPSYGSGARSMEMCRRFMFTRAARRCGDVLAALKATGSGARTWRRPMQNTRQRCSPWRTTWRMGRAVRRRPRSNRFSVLRLHASARLDAPVALAIDGVMVSMPKP